ncbi:MAG: dihydrofolate reductase [Bacilli bacterium]
MISIISAIGKNNEIGYENKLIWHIKEDLENFKKLTMNKKIIMGRKTYESLPKKLEGREYIVLTHNSNFIAENAIIFYDFKKLLTYIQTLKEEVMVIGGSSIYQSFLPYADILYLTEINESSINADAFFPSFDKKDFNQLIVKENHEGPLTYSFIKYERKS